MQQVQYCIVVPPANSILFPRYTCLSTSFDSQGRKVSDKCKIGYDFLVVQTTLVKT